MLVCIIVGGESGSIYGKITKHKDDNHGYAMYGTSYESTLRLQRCELCEIGLPILTLNHVTQ